MEQKITTANVVKFLENLGYRKLQLSEGAYQLVKIENSSILKIADDTDLMQEVKQKLLVENKDETAWEKFLQGDFINKKANLAFDIIKNINLNINSSDTAYFYFRNGALQVSKTEMKLIPYEYLNGYLFESQIIKFDLKMPDENYLYGSSMFNAFLQNVTNKDIDRYNQLITSIGYLLHGYKDASFTKAVILIDEKIDFSGESNGGTGKSLIGKAIAKMTKTLTKDGKNLSSGRFFYQDLDFTHRVMNLDDVKRDFDFEMFYSVVTGDMSVEQKYKKAYTLPFELSPKLLITSNYMVMGSGGNSDERRKIEIEITPYYNEEFSPMDDFQCRFFDDWNQEQWNAFFLDMAFYCQEFLRNGITVIQTINLQENKLISKTSLSFVAFADNQFIFSDNQDEITKVKGILYTDFTTKYPTESKFVSKIQFKKWIDIYAQHRGLKIHHFESNSDSKVTLSKT